MFKIAETKIAEKHLDKMITSATRLKMLTENEAQGWAEYVRLLDDYCNAMLEHKKGFNLSQATDEQIEILKWHDRDIWLINNFLRKLPFQFCINLEEAIKKQNEEEE